MRPIFANGQRVYHYKRTAAPKPKNDDPEFRLQRQCAEYLEVCLAPGIPWGATLNGVYLGPKTITKAKQTGFRRGPLDLFIIHDGRTKWLEAKIHPNKMTPEQVSFAAALDPDDWGVFYSFDEFVTLLKRMRIPFIHHTLGANHGATTG